MVLFPVCLITIADLPCWYFTFPMIPPAYSRDKERMKFSLLSSYSFAWAFIFIAAALLSFLEESKYLEISAILPYLRTVENIPSRAGVLSSTEPPFTSEAAIRVSNCLLWALRLGKFNLPSPVSSVGLFFLLVEVFCKISNAVARLWVGGVTSSSSWSTHSRIFSPFFCRRSNFFLRAESSLLFDRYSFRRVALSLASSATGNRFFCENASDLRGVLLFLLPIARSPRSWATGYFLSIKIEYFCYKFLHI